MTITQIVRNCRRLSAKRIPPKASGKIKIINVEYLHDWKEVDLTHSPGNIFVQLKHEGVTVTGQHTVSIVLQTPKRVTQAVAKAAPAKHFAIKPGMWKSILKFFGQYDGNTYYFQRPDKQRIDFLFNCSCPDFYFTWGIWVWRKGDLVGPKPPPYKRKTPPPPLGLPWRNPLHIPGACKHVLNSLDFLVQKGYLIGKISPQIKPEKPKKKTVQKKRPTTKRATTKKGTLRPVAAKSLTKPAMKSALKPAVKSK